MLWYRTVWQCRQCRHFEARCLRRGFLTICGGLLQYPVGGVRYLVWCGVVWYGVVCYRVWYPTARTLRTTHANQHNSRPRPARSPASLHVAALHPRLGGRPPPNTRTPPDHERHSGCTRNTRMRNPARNTHKKTRGKIWRQSVKSACTCMH